MSNVSNSQAGILPKGDGQQLIFPNKSTNAFKKKNMESTQEIMQNQNQVGRGRAVAGSITQTQPIPGTGAK